MIQNYTSETEKIREKMLPYLGDTPIDIGCAGSKVVAEAFGIDGRTFDDVDFVTDSLYDLPKQLPHLIGKATSVFSSHVLEHLTEDYRALLEWSQLICEDGYLLLYLPESELYNSYQNLEHTRNYNYKDFLFFFKRCFCGEGKNFKGQNFPAIFELVDHGMDVGYDKYSFYIIAKKFA